VLSVWRSAIVATLAAAAISTYALIIFGLPAGSVLMTSLDDVGMIVLLATASSLAFCAAGRQPAGRARWSWILIGLGLGCWMLGDSYWAWAELVLDEPLAVPSLADVAYVGQVVCVLCGILIRPIARPRDISRALLALDAAIVLSALTAVTWTVALNPLFRALGTTPLAQILSVSYPLADLAAVFFLVVMLVRSTEQRLATKLLTVGWGSVAVADAMYAILSAEDTYQTGHWIDLLWFAGVAVMAVAAVADRPQGSSLPSGPDIGRAWQFITPAILVVAAGLFVWLYPLGAEPRWPTTEQVALGLALGLLALRMTLGYRDAVLVHTLYVQRAQDRETARVALEEAARLQGVVLTGRELAHLLNNDLAISLGSVELLRAHPHLPPGLNGLVGDVSGGLERAVEHLRQLQHVSRVATKETPLGPALDLERSSSQESGDRSQ
jgi:hypothetical protein